MQYMNEYDAGKFVADCSSSALTTIESRYLLRDPDCPEKIVESIPEMFERVASTLAAVDADYGASEAEVEATKQEFMSVMVNRRFVPAGRTLINAGSPTSRLVANCVVLRIEDSMDGIFSTMRDAALLQQAGAGVGFPWHTLRPAGEPARTSGSRASGPLSFLRMYNSAFRTIKQQNRHGANMAVMSVDHPDILEFIEFKKLEGDIECFNCSVGITDEFMRQAYDPEYENLPWVCTFGDKEFYTREIERDEKFFVRTITETRLSAKQIMERIVHAAWRNGEPGVIFLDTINRTNPLPGLGRIEATNPCGEQALHDGDVCNLGSVIMGTHVDENGEIDYEMLKETTRVAIHMLDNVIDLLDFNVERVKKATTGNRRIGLGLMSVADAFYKMGVQYGSDEAIREAGRMMLCVQRAAEAQSELMGKERGVFPNFHLSEFHQINERENANIVRRNAALTSIAPTGTISRSFDVSGGMEPEFMLFTTHRNILNGKVLHTVNSHFLKACEDYGISGSDHPVIQYAMEHGRIADAPDDIGVPDEIRRVFVVTADISAKNHARMQAAFQQWCDNSISKTINFPNEATEYDVASGYYHAWNLGCKGCTVYRDGSRVYQVLNKLDASDADTNSLVSSSSATSMASSSSSTDELTAVDDGPECPDCNAKNTIRRVESCSTCVVCAWSACDTPPRRSSSQSPPSSKSAPTIIAITKHRNGIKPTNSLVVSE